MRFDIKKKQKSFGKYPLEVRMRIVDNRIKALKYDIKKKKIVIEDLTNYLNNLKLQYIR